MNKVIKLAVVSAVFINISACSWTGSKQAKPIEQPSELEATKAQLPFAASSPKMDAPPASAQVTPANRQTGVTHIRRYGKSFDIDVLLDTTDDNVSFEMDLPKYGDNPEDSMDVTENLTDQQKADKAKQSENKGAKKEPTADEMAKSSRHILYAQTYFYEGNYDRAISEVNQAIKLNPQSAVAFALKGSIHYKINEINKARIAWKSALDIDPGIDRVRYMLEKLDQ